MIGTTELVVSIVSLLGRPVNSVRRTAEWREHSIFPGPFAAFEAQYSFDGVALLMGGYVKVGLFLVSSLLRNSRFGRVAVVVLLCGFTSMTLCIDASRLCIVVTSGMKAALMNSTWLDVRPMTQISRLGASWGPTAR